MANCLYRRKCIDMHVGIQIFMSRSCSWGTSGVKYTNEKQRSDS